MNDYQLGYLQGLRDAHESAKQYTGSYPSMMLANITTLLTNYIAKFKRGG